MQITTVSSECHGNKVWHKPKDYRFAAQMAWLPLTAAEMPKAALAAPIGFMLTEQGFTPILCNFSISHGTPPVGEARWRTISGNGGMAPTCPMRSLR